MRTVEKKKPLPFDSPLDGDERYAQRSNIKYALLVLSPRRVCAAHSLFLFFVSPKFHSALRNSRSVTTTTRPYTTHVSTTTLGQRARVVRVRFPPIPHQWLSSRTYVTGDLKTQCPSRNRPITRTRYIHVYIYTRTEDAFHVVRLADHSSRTSLFRVMRARVLRRRLASSFGACVCVYVRARYITTGFHDKPPKDNGTRTPTHRVNRILHLGSVRFPCTFLVGRRRRYLPSFVNNICLHTAIQGRRNYVL